MNNVKPLDKHSNKREGKKHPNRKTSSLKQEDEETRKNIEKYGDRRRSIRNKDNAIGIKAIYLHVVSWEQDIQSEENAKNNGNNNTIRVKRRSVFILKLVKRSSEKLILKEGWN